jgi:hypothetical protein
MKEPSVLDYVKALLAPWKGKPPELPKLEEKVAEEQVALQQNDEPVLAASLETISTPVEPVTHIDTMGQAVISAPDESINISEKLSEPGFSDYPKGQGWPLRTILALIIALAAQQLLEAPNRTYMVPVVFYIFSGACLVWAYIANEWKIRPLREDSQEPFNLTVRKPGIWFSIPFILVSFLFFGGDEFTSLNITLWLLAIAGLLFAFWQPQKTFRQWIRDTFRIFTRSSWNIKISPYFLLVVVSVVVIIFFRVYQLNQVPGEMFSDHAEKLLDVSDVLAGKTSIFFPRNTGREAIQMYLTAAISILLGTGLSFISLKIGTVLAGLLTLPYIYKLGKEFANRWVGFFALILAGIAYWPNVISRVGLRFPLYALFAAPALYYLIRGIRTASRNDFILSGIAVGLGLHGYSPARIVPFVIVIAIGVYLLHNKSQSKTKQYLWLLGILALVAFVVFLPLFRYALDNPDMFNYRALTRIGTIERPFPAPVWQIFLSNLWNCWTMIWWSNGSIWVHSVPNRPALDVVTAVFYFIGLLVLVIRYIRQRHWLDLFMILAVPLLMMPSILSLAFPDENPSLNRTAAAIVPVFVIAAVGMENIIGNLVSRSRSKIVGGIAVAFTLVMLGWSASSNYDLVFNQYKEEFLNGTWNTSDMGRVIRGFSTTWGSADNAYVVAFPYWVDTRLVGINAGYPTTDYAISADKFQDTLNQKGAKLFILNPQDQDDLTKLEKIYPSAYLNTFKSPREGKDFLMLLVPPTATNTP